MTRIISFWCVWACVYVGVHVSVTERKELNVLFSLVTLRVCVRLFNVEVQLLMSTHYYFCLFQRINLKSIQYWHKRGFSFVVVVFLKYSGCYCTNLFSPIAGMIWGFIEIFLL